MECFKILKDFVEYWTIDGLDIDLASSLILSKSFIFKYSDNL